MSIFPFINPEMAGQTERELPLFQEYAYDFTENRLLLDEENRTYLVQGNAALRIWIFKALSTARFRYTAYSPDFGNEYEDNLIGQNISEDVLAAEMERYIIECLMVNPYIQELSNFQFEIHTSGTDVSFDCLTIYGEEKMIFLMEGVSA